MKKQKCLATSALLCTAILGAISPVPRTYATFNNSVDGSSYFDTNAQRCVVENYNAENATSITSIEQIDPTRLTALDCSGRGIVNFKGVTILTNLKTLNISNNPDLQTYDNSFLTPASLKTINISNSGNYFDFSNSPALETITTNRDVSIKTSTYIEKLNNDSEYAYGMNLSGLKFLNSNTPVSESEYPSKYDTNTKTIAYKNRDKIPYSVPVKVGNYTLNILSRNGFISYFAYFEDKKPLHIQENCKEAEDYFMCDSRVYHGDIIDTDAFIKMFNLSDYSLTKVEIVPPTANVKLTTNEKTVKKGTVLADADFTVKFYFSSNDVAVPNTGAFTAEKATIIATTATTAIVLVGIAIYISRYSIKHQKTKVSFNKK